MAVAMAMPWLEVQSCQYLLAVLCSAEKRVQLFGPLVSRTLVRQVSMGKSLERTHQGKIGGKDSILRSLGYGQRGKIGAQSKLAATHLIEYKALGSPMTPLIHCCFLY